MDLCRRKKATLVIEKMDSLARNRLVDISICLTGLVEMAAGLSDASSSAVTAIKDALGVVEARSFHGGETELVIRVGDGLLRCLVSPKDPGSRTKVGDQVSILIPPEAVRFVPPSE